MIMEPSVKTEKVEMCKQKPSSEKGHPDHIPKTETKTIHQKIVELYKNEKSRQINESIVTGSHLLKKLVTKDKLNVLVVTLHPGNKGYSLLLKMPSSCDSETIHLPYEEEELLEYIDNEQLPPILVDLLERSKEVIFYSGCVIVEVRDFRTCENKPSNFTLLKPTNQSLICDLHQIFNNGHKWTMEEKQSMESSLIMATSQPLCLDPSPSIAFLLNKIQYQKNMLSKPALKRSIKSKTQHTLNKKVRLAQCKAPSSLKLFDFLKKKKKPSSLFHPLKRGVNACMDEDYPIYKVPENLEVEQRAQPIPPSNPSPENDIVAVEELIMEVQDKNCGKVSFTHMTILQNSSDEQYMGRLDIARDGQDSGTSCVYKLGDYACVQKYIDQFTEIFTEKGRRSVKITRLVPGHAPVITFTQGAKDNMAEKFILPNLTAALSAPIKDPDEASSLASGHSEKVTIKHEEPSSAESSPIDVMTASPPPLSTHRLSTETTSAEQAIHEGSHLSSQIHISEEPLSLTTQLCSESLSISPSLGPGLSLTPNYSLYNLVPIGGDLSSVSSRDLAFSLGSSAVIVSTGGMNPSMLSSPLSLATPNLAAQLMASTFSQSGPSMSLLQAPLPLLSSHPLVRPKPPRAPKD